MPKSHSRFQENINAAAGLRNTRNFNQRNTPTNRIHGTRYSKINAQSRQQKAKINQKEAQENLNRKKQALINAKKKECINAKNRVERNMNPGIIAAENKLNSYKTQVKHMNSQVNNASKNKSRARLEAGAYKGIGGSFLKMKNKFRTRKNVNGSSPPPQPKKSMMKKIKFWGK